MLCYRYWPIILVGWIFFVDLVDHLSCRPLLGKISILCFSSVVWNSDYPDYVPFNEWVGFLCSEFLFQLLMITVDVHFVRGNFSILIMVPVWILVIIYPCLLCSDFLYFKIQWMGTSDICQWDFVFSDRRETYHLMFLDCCHPYPSLRGNVRMLMNSLVLRWIVTFVF